MKLLKMAGCLVILNAALNPGFAQSPVQLPANPLRQTSIPKDSILLKNATGVGKRQMETLLGTAKNPLQPLTGQLKLFEGGRPVKFNQLDIEAGYNYFRDTSGMSMGPFSNTQGLIGYNINYAMSLQSMPFNISLRESNGINAMNYTPFQNFYKFNFDHTKYIESVRAKVMEKMNPDAIMASALSRVNAIRQNYEQGLQSEVAQLQGAYTKEYKSSITLPANATSLSANDMGALQNQMIPGSALEKYRQDLLRLQEMARDKDEKPLAADTNYHKLQGEVKKYETLENIYGKITGYKKRFENNALVKELKSHLPFNPGNVRSYLADPANLEKVLDDQGGLSMLQRLFVNVTKLDMGQNAVQSGELAMQNTMNTGVNTEFRNKATTMGVIYGKNSSVNNWQQAGLTSQVTNEYSNLTGFKLGTGSGSPIDQSISFNFFNFNNAPSPGLSGSSGSSYLPLAPHKDGVISLHTGLPLSPLHSISLDVSKSFGSFKQNVRGDSSLNKAIPDGSVFNNAGKSNYAAILSYAGQVINTDVKLYVKTVGLGYNNPGNPLLRSGESQLGLGFTRKFLRQRLSAKYDGDYKHQVFDPAHNYTYTAFTNKWQLGYKITRNDKVNLTYQRSDYRSAFYGQAASNGTNARLQLDGAYRFILSGKKVMNNVTISHQQFSLPMTTGGTYTNNTLLFTNTSSVMLGKNLLSLTLLENHADNKSYYFNTSMFSSEVNYSYALSESGNIRMASCIGYYDNAGWNRQLGAKQQISAQLKQQLTLDFQVGCRKAIRTIRPELADQLFLNTTVYYTFK